MPMSRPMLVSKRSARTLALASMLGVALSLFAAACSGLVGSDPAETASGSGSETTGSESGQDGLDPPEDLASTSPESTDQATRGLRCQSVSEDAIGTVERADLIEASGVVASRRHDGVLWSHNDSGGRAGVFAFDLEGNDLGFFELAVAAVDIEDIAIDDHTIYLADIGDNPRTRDSVTIHVFDEPDPRASDQPAEQIESSRAITLNYPDGSSDAEAFLVDPTSGDLIILGKNLDDSSAPTIIYSADSALLPSGTSAEPIEMTRSGSIDVAELTRRSSAFSLSGLAFPGAATGVDITEDGSLIALRTYGSVWLFDRSPGASVAEALSGEPCEGGAEAETQGESVGFLPPETGDPDEPIRYVTVSEGRNPPVNLSVIEIDRG